jgi:hypothetical protein
LEERETGLKERVGVLKGNLHVDSGPFFKRETASVKPLEYIDAEKGLPLGKPVRVTREYWNQLKEAYELCATSAEAEAVQLDLSKHAGTFFKYVFDHGTFYTPKIGFARREFVKDDASGDVYFELEYDVFPKGSYVGMYTKARDFDLSQFKAFEFEVRTIPDEGFPESLRIEVKSGTNIVKVFQPFGFTPTWQKISIPIHYEKATPINEVTIVILNEKAGENKKGILHFKRFNVIPLDDSGMPKEISAMPELPQAPR